jgi:hypothetical protein
MSDDDRMIRQEQAIQHLNLRVAEVVEQGALELLQAGGTNGFAAGLRSMIFVSIGKLDDLDELERRADLERIKTHCDELLEAT